MKERARTRNKGENPQLEMTPMIDVVFQLLIFFIVTTKQEDILARLNADRPAPDKNPNPNPDINPEFLDIEISKLAVILTRNTLAADLRPANPNFDILDRELARHAKLNPSATVTIRCTMDSSHGSLVRVLDILNKNNFKTINIFSFGT